MLGSQESVVLLPDPADLPDPVLPPDPLAGVCRDLVPDGPPELWLPVGDDLDDVAGLGEWPPAGLAADLDATVPGPLLADLLDATDLTGCSDSELVGAVRAAYRLQSWAASVEVEATCTLVGRCETWRGVAPHGQQVAGESVSAELMAATEVGCALDLAPQTARGKVALAMDLARLPATRAGLSVGVLDLPKARMLAEELRPLDDARAQAVEARLGPGASGRTRAQLAGSVRRAVLAIAPQDAQERHERSVADRRVEFFPLSEGMAGMTWTGSAERVEAFRVWLDGLARQAKGPAGTDERTMDQVRADVLGDLAEHALTVSDLPVRHGRRPQVQVVVGLGTLLGLDEAPGELAGYGPITAGTARRIAADATWRRLTVDPRTGRFDELSVDSYEPPQDMADHVAARDVTCRSPGCRQPAHRCDLDHRVPHPRGPTDAANLQLLCRSHHTVKTHTATAVEIDGTDGLRFTLPSGRSYVRPDDRALADPVDTPPF